ncbi:gluconokinase [Oerskovia paurometabola]|uniref:Gluconokinase n=1 Tax=Oerskovia paurometabola TaxID=162170 RepID=A0ABW1X5K7_9CELL|nr:gluconokinase [Oerskovia paurometabola]MBM7495779.1 gluconokinase [Oerskovia paurometabola]
MDTDVSPAPTPGSETEPVHLVIMGVAGSGKTTVATLIAERTHRPYAEADEFHPQANIDKMSAGTPLTDEDRWPWLRAMRDWLDEQAAEGDSAVVTCSALKRTYRDLLRTAHGRVRFVHLTGSPELLEERMTHRSGHFMPASLLPSQLATLEPLADDEDGITLDVGTPPEELVDRILATSALPHPTIPRSPRHLAGDPRTDTDTDTEER